MKQATGELNATVFVIMAVGVLMAFFYYTLWPILRDNFKRNSQCSKAVCEKCPSGRVCDTVTCHSKDDPNGASFECVYKG